MSRPFIKKDDPSVVSNYRPISLLSTVGKILERIVHKHTFNFFPDLCWFRGKNRPDVFLCVT